VSAEYDADELPVKFLYLICLSIIMEVEEFQKEIVKFMKMWAKKRGSPDTEQLTFNHLVEEVGELAREFVNRDARKDKFSDKEYDNTIGDILVNLVVLAELRGVKIEKLVMDIIREDSKTLLK
jgi:NTP pyrophosphatase (non-canonical NTP hydrolase)